MAIDRDRLRWNGWGFRDRDPGFSEPRAEAILAGLEARLERRLPREPQRAAGLGEVTLPPSRLTPAARDRLRSALGAMGLDDGAAARAIHAAGKGLPDLLRLRTGQLRRAPDAVVRPASVSQVRAVLRIAAEEDLAVVPFGGGSSVVGGVEPLGGELHRGVLCLDTSRLDQLIELDEVSGTARFEAGIDGPGLEAALEERGYTLGHFPQSFEHSTLGGWIAARSSGQQSDGYGGIEALLVSVRLVSPAGELATLGVPRRAAGPELREVVCGSEGTLGVIVEATVRVRRRPRRLDVRGMLFRRWEDGSATIRRLREEGGALTMCRLSDAAETAFGVLLQTDPERGVDLKGRALGATRFLGYGEERCLMLYAAEGDDGAAVREGLGRVFRAAAQHGGLPLGASPGRSWLAHRFHTPYLRDWLLDRGLAIETLETSVPWGRIDRARARIVDALDAALDREAGGGGVMAHLSHSYRDGACLYFIVVYPYVGGGVEGAGTHRDPVEAAEAAVAQWGRIKAAAMDAVVRAGGTVSHHHGVGTEHRPWLAGEVGELGLDALRAFKARLDPAGIMNPGKLL